MVKPQKQEKAVLETTGERVNNCIIIRKDKNGKFYWISVFKNGNYGDKVGNLSETISSCKAKIKSTMRWWSDKIRTTGTTYGGVVGLFLDYEGAKKKTDRVTL